MNEQTPSRASFVERSFVDWPSFFVGLLLLVAGCSLHYGLGYFHDDLSGNTFGVDDAFISFRYAENLAAGEGLVFNPASSTNPVEGFSNLLWVLILALAYPIVSKTGFYGVSVGLAALAHVATFVLLHRRLVSECSRPLARAGTLAFALSPIWWLWTTSGLETVFFASLQFGLVLSSTTPEERDCHPLLPLILSGLLILTRADGFVFVGMVAVLLWRRRRGLALRLLIGMALVLAIVTLFRLYYFGDYVPNTVRAKVTGGLFERLVSASKGLFHATFQSGMAAFWLPLLWPLATPFSALLPARLSWRRAFADRARVTHHQFLWTGLTVGLLLYFLSVGGDVFRERFLIVLVPLGILAAARLSDRLWSPRLGLRVFVAIGLLQFLPLIVDPRFAYRSKSYDRWTNLGQFLGETYPGATLACDAAGKLPFFAELETIDMLGLNDRHIGQSEAREFFIGHSKYDPEYVLAQEPELIAAWIYETLDMRWGLGRDLYQSRGYELRYLVYADVEPPGPWRLDVAGLSDSVCRDWFDRGYRYAVLQKTH